MDAPESSATRPGKTGRSPESNAFVSQFGGGRAIDAVVEMAHDMRSPLTSILFLVDTLRRGYSGPLTSAQERQLGLIYGAALGLNTLACDVIDSVKGARGLFDGEPVPMSISEVIFGVCDTVRPISEEKRLPIRQTLPVVDARLGHPAALSRVLLNLISNALKYTREGSVSIGCTELDGPRVCFWVEDTGDGIPPHVLEQLFESFRPSGAAVRFSNAGLGLAICQHFLTTLGTRLEVKTSPDTGTRFFFELDLPVTQ